MSRQETPAVEERAAQPRSSRRLLLILSSVLLLLALMIAVLVHRSNARIPAPIQLAVAMPLSGPQGHQGKLVLDAVLLGQEQINREGGIQGHPLQIVPYDDQGKPDVAMAKAKEIAASPALAVIGHFSSATTVPAGKIYKGARIPAITASANAPSITLNNPYYFRVTMDTSSQGHTMAAYAVKVLKKNHASVLYSNEVYGKSLLAAFTDEYIDEGGSLDNKWAWNSEGGEQQRAALIQKVSKDIADGDGGIIILAISPFSAAKEALMLLRRTGVNPLILGGSALGSDFPRQFVNEPEEKREPGFFTNNTYIASPIIFDSAPERAQIFADTFYQRYRDYADERAAQNYDVMMLLRQALRQNGMRLTPGDRDGDRQRIASWLGTQTNPSLATPGLTGPIYFDEKQSLPQPVRIGRCVEGHVVSAPIQLEAVPNPALIDLDAELAAGHAIRIQQTFYRLQRVVYTGIDINQISRIDPSKGSFTADFYLWFRYAGDNQVRDVDLNAASEKSPYDAKNPLLEQHSNGLNYSLYRVHGDFRTTYDFHSYPFDAQALTLRLTNPRMTRQEVIYAIDTFGLRLPRPDGGVSQLRPLSNWSFTGIRHESDTLTSDSTRGQPGAFHSHYETQFSEYNTVINIKRRTLVYLFKNLLPLLLLVLVVYVTLYFPPSLTKERLTIGISAMLASAVLLTAINSQLTDVGYPTAIEYGFYAFFALCLYCVLAALIAERLHSRKNVNAAVRFDIAARITYPVITFAVFLGYYFRYF